MIRLEFSIELNYEIDQPGCDFIFSIHAAQTRHQVVVSESLAISQNLAPNLYTDPVTHTRYLRLKAFAGPLLVRYEATVDLDHHTAPPEQIAEVPVADLPGSVLPYVGGVRGAAPLMHIAAIPNEQGALMLPQHVAYALSTDGL